MAARHVVWAMCGSLLAGGLSIALGQWPPRRPATPMDDLEALVRALEPLAPLAPNTFKHLQDLTARVVVLLGDIRLHRSDEAIHRDATFGLGCVTALRNVLDVMRNKVSMKGYGHAEIIKTMELGFSEINAEVAQIERLFYNFISRSRAT